MFKVSSDEHHPDRQTVRLCTGHVHGLRLEVPYRCGSETRISIPDSVVLVDDGHGENDLMHLIVGIKGYRREDARDKKATMETYWAPGVDNLGIYGRWAFAGFTEVHRLGTDFEAKVQSEFEKTIYSATVKPKD